MARCAASSRSAHRFERLFVADHDRTPDAYDSGAISVSFERLETSFELVDAGS
jgi:hypothetical protein